MVKPLYPLSDIRPDQRKKQKEAEQARIAAKKATRMEIIKNPYVILSTILSLVLIIVVITHISRSSHTLDASASPSGSESSALGLFKSSKYFSSDKSKDIGANQKEQLKQMGIDSGVESMGIKIEAKDLREQRKILAMRKYEASRQTADRRVKEKEEQRDRLKRGSSMQLKEAIMAVEDSNTLGIMKLERLLDEKLLSSGGDSQDLDVLIFAYDRLARAYENKNMEVKAKEAYINAFKLMKRQAPDSQGPDWDNAISNVEQIRAKPSR